MATASFLRTAKAKASQVDIGGAGAGRRPCAARGVRRATMCNRAPVGDPARAIVCEARGCRGGWNAQRVDFEVALLWQPELDALLLLAPG
jgi:hypothetical protein